jgi:hypothetical protein
MDNRTGQVCFSCGVPSAWFRMYYNSGTIIYMTNISFEIQEIIIMEYGAGHGV